MSSLILYIYFLISQLRRLDSVEKKVTLTDGFPRDKFKYMVGYEMLLNNLGVSFQWHIGKERKKLEHRDLAGPEKLKLFQHIQMPIILPTCESSA